MGQAEAMLVDRQGWAAQSVQGVTVEAKPLSGAFESSGIPMLRAESDVDADADALFDLLISAQGYLIIDPWSEEEELSKYIERYDGYKPTMPGAKLEMANAFVKSEMFPRLMKPGQKQKEYIILNSHDPSARLFTSTSMLHESNPGGSKYQTEMPVDGPRTERCLNTFVVKVIPTGSNRCRVQCCHWIYFNFGGKLETKMTMGFFGPFFDRLKQAGIKLR